jgi:putative membrane protein
MRPAPKVNEMVLVHMVRHILLGAVAPPLVWFAASVLPQPRWLLPRTSLGRLMTNPMTSWLAATLTVIGWHVPIAFGLAQRSVVWHGVQDTSFLATGLLFWWPVVRPWPAAERLPRAAIPLYLFAATLPCDALSAFLVFCDRVVYRPYLGSAHHVDTSALADQQAAGAVMWVSITFLYLVPAIAMTVQALSPGPQRGGHHGSSGRLETHALPIRTPVRNTSAPPTNTSMPAETTGVSM